MGTEIKPRVKRAPKPKTTQKGKALEKAYAEKDKGTDVVDLIIKPLKKDKPKSLSAGRKRINKIRRERAAGELKKKYYGG